MVNPEGAAERCALRVWNREDGRLKLISLCNKARPDRSSANASAGDRGSKAPQSRLPLLVAAGAQSQAATAAAPAAADCMEQAVAAHGDDHEHSRDGASASGNGAGPGKHPSNGASASDSGAGPERRGSGGAPQSSNGVGPGPVADETPARACADSAGRERSASAAGVGAAQGGAAARSSGNGAGPASAEAAEGRASHSSNGAEPGERVPDRGSEAEHGVAGCSGGSPAAGALEDSGADVLGEPCNASAAEPRSDRADASAGAQLSTDPDSDPDPGSSPAMASALASLPQSDGEWESSPRAGGSSDDSADEGWAGMVALRGWRNGRRQGEGPTEASGPAGGPG